MVFDAKHDMNGTSADPLKQQRAEHGLELWDRILQIVNGFSYDTVVSVGVSLIINAIRQASPTARDAEEMFDRIAAHGKGVLLDEHYDKASGKRKSIFAHVQNLTAPFFDARSKSLRGQ